TSGQCIAHMGASGRARSRCRRAPRGGNRRPRRRRPRPQFVGQHHRHVPAPRAVTPPAVVVGPPGDNGMSAGKSTRAEGSSMLLLIAVAIGLIPAMIASGKGRGFLVWWIYGALIFIVALPHALMLSRE